MSRGQGGIADAKINALESEVKAWVEADRISTAKVLELRDEIARKDKALEKLATVSPSIDMEYWRKLAQEALENKFKFEAKHG